VRASLTLAEYLRVILPTSFYNLIQHFLAGMGFLSRLGQDYVNLPWASGA
jgi:hypothetical protein